MSLNLRVASSSTGSFPVLPASGETRLIAVFHPDLGTSASRRLPTNLVAGSLRASGQTTSHPQLERERSDRPSIPVFRRLSGLTWDQIAGVFQVSRRAVHFWASGNPMSPEHETKLVRVLGVVHAIDRGTAAANRELLLLRGPGGETPLDLLASGRFDEVVARLGRGVTRAVPRSQAKELHRPAAPPGILADALEDTVHESPGKLRRSWPIRRRQK